MTSHIKQKWWQRFYHWTKNAFANANMLEYGGGISFVFGGVVGIQSILTYVDAIAQLPHATLIINGCALGTTPITFVIGFLAAAASRKVVKIVREKLSGTSSTEHTFLEELEEDHGAPRFIKYVINKLISLRNQIETSKAPSEQQFSSNVEQKQWSVDREYSNEDFDIEYNKLDKELKQLLIDYQKCQSEERKYSSSFSEIMLSLQHLDCKLSNIATKIQVEDLKGILTSVSTQAQLSSIHSAGAKNLLAITNQQVHGRTFLTPKPPRQQQDIAVSSSSGLSQRLLVSPSNLFPRYLSTLNHDDQKNKVIATTKGQTIPAPYVV